MDRFVRDYLSSNVAQIKFIAGGPGLRGGSWVLPKSSFLQKYHPPRFQGGKRHKQSGGMSVKTIKQFTPAPLPLPFPYGYMG